MNHDSDPLPYVMFDRAAAPAAALLAAEIGVTPQHAVGSLIAFWNLCGSPREIERLAELGVLEVVLPNDELIRRFRLASGKPVDPATLVSLGFAEARPKEHSRVKGMSRFFEPIVRRLEKREAGSKGGKRSADVRKSRFGSSQPASGLLEQRRSTVRSSAEADAEAPSEAPFEAPFEAVPKPTEAADSGHPVSFSETKDFEFSPASAAMADAHRVDLEISEPDPFEFKAHARAKAQPPPERTPDDDDPRAALDALLGAKAPDPPRDVSHLGGHASAAGVDASDAKSRDFYKRTEQERKSRRLKPAAAPDAGKLGDWYLLAQRKHGLTDVDLWAAYLRFLNGWGLEKDPNGRRRDGSLRLFISSENIWLDRARELHQDSAAKPAIRFPAPTKRPPKKPPKIRHCADCGVVCEGSAWIRNGRELCATHFDAPQAVAR